MNTATQSQPLVKAEPRRQTPPRAISTQPQGQRSGTANNTSTRAKAASSASASASTASANGASFNLDLSTFLTRAQRIFPQFQQHMICQQQSPGSQVHASANDASSNPKLWAFLTIAHLALLQCQQQRINQQSAKGEVPQTANRQCLEGANGHKTEPQQQTCPESQASQTTSWQSSERVDRQVPASAPILTPVPASSSTITKAPSPLALVGVRSRTSARALGRSRPHLKNTSNDKSTSLHSRADQVRSRKQVKARRRALRRVWEQDLPAREITQYGDELITLNGTLTAVFANGRRAKYYFKPHGENEGMSLQDGSLADYILQELSPQDPPNQVQ